MNRKLKPLVIFFSIFLVFATSSRAQVTATKAWARATVPNQQSTGAFMHLVSKTDTALVSARSDIAGIVEVHEMTVENDVM